MWAIVWTDCCRWNFGAPPSCHSLRLPSYVKFWVYNENMPQNNSVIVTYATLLSWMGAWGSPTAKPSRAWGTVPDSQRHFRVFGTSLRWDVMDGCVELNLRIPMFAWWYFIDLGIEFNTQSFQSRVPGYSLCIWFGPGPRSWLKSLYRKITKKEREKFKAASAALKVTTKKKKADGSTSVSLPKMCFASRKIYNIELLAGSLWTSIPHGFLLWGAADQDYRRPRFILQAMAKGLYTCTKCWWMQKVCTWWLPSN